MVRSLISKILNTLYRIIRAPKFFYVVVGLLFVQAAWFAFSAQYPMAFDEEYHFGIIQIYSQQWLPFIAQNPAGSESFGDLTRYSSYMYHYLMSFPYRLIEPFTNWFTQIMVLRFIAIGLFIAGMFMFRHFFRRLKISESIINFTFLILVFIPVVPFLAATINYDNLAFLVVPLFASLTYSCGEAIRRGKLPASLLVPMVSVGIFGSLIKYAFLPILAVGLLYVLVLWLIGNKKRSVLASIYTSFKKNSRLVRLALVLATIVFGGLFIERYGVNLAAYQRFEPTCASVRPISDCVHRGPWNRNNNLRSYVEANNPPHDPPQYLIAPVWAGNYVYRLYFAVNHDYATAEPLPIPYATAYAIGISSLLLCLIFWRSLIKSNRYLLLFALFIFIYVAALFYTNFSSYMNLRTITAANGRYLILVLPLMFVWFALAYQQFFRRIFKSRSRKMLTGLSALVFVLTIWGGGASTHLLRAEPYWYWQSGPAPQINPAIKDILSPIVPGSR